MSKVLVVVDMQHDFIDGSLGTEEAVKIVPNVINKIHEYNVKGNKIIYTRDTHNSNYLETQEGKMLPVKHCILNDEGWNTYPGIILSQAEAEADIRLINKPSFGYTGWFEEHLERFDEVEIIGLCTDICVISNALIIKAMYPELPITVDASCCAGVTLEKHLAAIETMKSCQMIVINE